MGSLLLELPLISCKNSIFVPPCDNSCKCYAQIWMFCLLHSVLPYCLIFVFLFFQKNDSLGKLYEMDDSPDRRIWVDKLLQFMEERGTPIPQCPTISKNPLDLFRLYVYVKERGGFMEVCKVQCSSMVTLVYFFRGYCFLLQHECWRF